MSTTVRQPAADTMDTALELRTLATAIRDRDAADLLIDRLGMGAFVGVHHAALLVALSRVAFETPAGEDLDPLSLAKHFCELAHLSEHGGYRVFSDLLGPIGDSSLMPKLDAPKYMRSLDRLAELEALRAVAVAAEGVTNAAGAGFGTAAAERRLSEAQARLASLRARRDDAGDPADDLEYRPFPAELLPPAFARFVVGGAAAIGCDPAFIGLPLLAATAAAVGNARRLSIKRGWTEPAVLWAAVVGESGTAKSPALELALRPVRERQRRALRDHEDAERLHAADLLRFEAEIADWKRTRAGEPPRKPVAPTVPRTWLDDVTTEAVGRRLRENPRGLLLARDELAGLFGSFDRYAATRGGDVARWLEMHAGRPMIVDRAGGDTLNVPRAAVSICGGIQPDALRAALRPELFANGFAARFLLAMPPRMPRHWSERDVDPAVEAAVEAIFERLYELGFDPDDNGNERPRLVGLSPAAKEAWVQFFNAHGAEQAELSGDLAAAWAKIEGYAARLALLVHLVRAAAHDPTCIDPDQLDAASVEAGVGLSRWFGRECRRVYAMLGGDAEEHAHRALLDWMRRRGGATASEAARGLRQFRRDADAAGRAMTELVRRGLAEWQNGSQNGRPTVRCVPKSPTPVPETPENPEKIGLSGTRYTGTAPETDPPGPPDDVRYNCAEADGYVWADVLDFE